MSSGKTEVIDIPTWYELKKFVSELTGDQLGQPIMTEDSKNEELRKALRILKDGDRLLIQLS